MIELVKGLSSSFLKPPLEAYLRRVEEPKRTLGPESDDPAQSATPDPAAGDDLLRSMGSARKLQDRLFFLCFVVLVLLLVLHVGWLTYSVISKSNWNWALAGSLVLWPIIWFLRRLWIDSVFIAMVRDIVRDFPPEEAAKVIAVVYRGSMLTKSSMFEPGPEKGE